MNIGIMDCHYQENESSTEVFGYRSGQSLLMYDIVIWRPEFVSYDYHLQIKSELVQLIKDQKRRLSEFRKLLERGDSLFIMIPPPQSLFPSETNDFRKYEECIEILRKEMLDPESFDIFSLFLPELEKDMREFTIDASDCRMDFRGDSSLVPAWKLLKGQSWISSYLLSPIGNPFLFLANTDYVAGSWMRYLNGNIFLIPSTQYDDSADYPLFAKAAKMLDEGVKNLSGKNITINWEDENDVDGNEEFDSTFYIHQSRINDLQRISNCSFDLTKLIRLCEEVNIAYSKNAYFSVIMLIRAILDHIPPIFGYENFSDLANCYDGGRSFKEIMERLDKVSRKIADKHLHERIRKKTVLPNKVQVDFSNEIDILLSEIIVKCSNL